MAIPLLGFKMPESAKTFPGGVREGVILRDPSRNKQIPLRIFYPKANGKFPVVLLASSESGGFQYLGEAIAEDGFIVVQLASASSQDLSSVESQLPLLERLAPEVQGKVDPTRLAIVGHAGGAVAAIQIALEPRGQQLRATIAISPPGVGKHFSSRDFAKLKGPVLFVTGSEDRGPQKQAPIWRRDAFDRSPKGGKYLAWIEGATQRSFEGKHSKTDAFAIENTKRLAVAFLRAQLQGDRGAKLFLEQRLIEGLTRSRVRMFVK